MKVKCSVCGGIFLGKATSNRGYADTDGSERYPRRHKGPDGKPCPGNIEYAIWIQDDPVIKKEGHIIKDAIADMESMMDHAVVASVNKEVEKELKKINHRKKAKTSEWISVEGKDFIDGEMVDIWSESYGRLPNYRFRKNYANVEGNDFFEPIFAGIACVRDATHWMPFPEPPK